MSRDPDIVAKVKDVVGLYLNPPEHAVVLSVDEKTSIQALPPHGLAATEARAGKGLAAGRPPLVGLISITRADQADHGAAIS